MKRADFNLGEAVYKNKVVLTALGDRTYKITSTEGEKTFRMWDFVTLLGSFVEFDILVFDSDAQDLKIRCVFKTAALAKNLSYSVKPEIHYEVKIH